MSTGQKILVADDSLTIRKLVETVLLEEGYEVLTAQTGAECLALAASQQPSLILLDYILPDKQGTEICRELINSPETWEIPILMMSSNGNAIRQLYQDLNNVADYLTKPFAPNVLKAVVGHLLRPEPTAAEPAGANPALGQAGPGAEPSMPKDFMDKVSRLLDLMEKGPTPSPGASAVQSAPAAEPPSKAKARRPRKALACTPTPEGLLRKVRLAIQKHLRPRFSQIPDLETNRGSEEAGQFFLSRLLSKEVLGELSGSLLRASGLPAAGAGALRCPVSLVALDGLLRHLQAQRATGELHIESAEETVLLCLEQGQPVLLSSNHPRHYCAGALCDFSAVPHTAISEAIRAQEEQSLPFFVALQERGLLPAGAELERLLASQGDKCLSRAFSAPEAVASFHPLSKLSARVRPYRHERPLNQLLLSCYRTVEDWFTLEKAFTDFEAILVPTPEMALVLEQLSLEPQESSLLALVKAGRTVSELVAASGLKQFEVCRVLYRFLKLGLIRHGARRCHDERVDEGLESGSASPLASAAPPAPTGQPEPPALLAPTQDLPPASEPLPVAVTEPCSIGAPSPRPADSCEPAAPATPEAQPPQSTAQASDSEPQCARLGAEPGPEASLSQAQALGSEPAQASAPADSQPFNPALSNAL